MYSLTKKFIIIGLILLPFNQRVGWFDSGGANLIAVILRSDTWLVPIILLSILFSKSTLLKIPPLTSLSRNILWTLPSKIILCILFATVVSEFRYGVGYNNFGFLDFIKIILCILFGLIIYNISSDDKIFKIKIINIYIWISSINLFAALFYLLTSINNIEGFNGLTAGEIEVGLGFMGYGDRFQGVGSNPNIVMTHIIISLSLIIQKLNGDIKIIKKIIYFIYSSFLIIMAFTTGVRAFFVLFFIILTINFMINMKKSSHKTIVMNFLVLIVSIPLIFFIGFELGLMDIVLDRFSNQDGGRLDLWGIYLNLLASNLLGLGIPFESIFNTGQVYINQNGDTRLPPHNSLLQIAIYGGVISLIFTILGLYRIIIAYIKNHNFENNNTTDCIFLAWAAVTLNSFFGGLLLTDYNYIVFTSILLASLTKFTKI